MLVVDKELAELGGSTGVTEVEATIVTEVDDTVTPEAVVLGAVGLARLMLTLLVVFKLAGVLGFGAIFVLVLVLVLTLILVLTLVIVLMLVLMLALALMLALVLIAELLVGTMTIGEEALEATGKLVIVVDRIVEDEEPELLTTGIVLFLHCMLC